MTLPSATRRPRTGRTRNIPVNKSGVNTVLSMNGPIISRAVQKESKIHQRDCHPSQSPTKLKLSRRAFSKRRPDGARREYVYFPASQDARKVLPWQKRVGRGGRSSNIHRCEERHFKGRPSGRPEQRFFLFLSLPSCFPADAATPRLRCLLGT